MTRPSAPQTRNNHRASTPSTGSRLLRMDVLLSLPIFSYFATPVLTSWSTSLNLLFFYLTWATLVFSHSPLKIEIIGTAAIRLIFWLLPSLLFALFDALLPGLAEPLKLHTPPRPTLSTQARHTALALTNVALCTALQAAISSTWTAVLHRPPFKTSTTLPLPWHILKHIITLYALREILTYYIHRHILHAKGSRLAKLHAEYAHATKGTAPYSLMLFADHPFPLLLIRFVPTYAPALLVRPHLLTFFLFMLLTTVEETLCMSGYNVVPGFFMGGIARRTATHYASGGKGNFGVWGVSDYLHGTSLGEDIFGDIKDEVRAKQGKGNGRVKKSGNGGSSKTGKMMQDVLGARKRKTGRKKVDA